MQPQVSPQEIVQALLQDSALQLEDGHDGYLRKGVCPSCGQNKLFIKSSEPWVLKCGRENKCSWTSTTRELLPDLFNKFTKNHPPTPETPHATADAYLAINRMFDLSKIRGMYELATANFKDGEENGKPIFGTAPSVRFYLNEDRNIWWERFIEKRPSDERKAQARGKFRGMSWTPKDFELEDGERCFIVEGVFHLLGLLHAGHKAASSISCSNFASQLIEANKGRDIVWTLAFDGDPAGQKYNKKYASKIKAMGERCEVLTLPDNGKDWDDYWREGKLNDKLIQDGLYRGRLFMAESVNEKAWYHYVRKHKERFILDFGSALYSIHVKSDFDSDCTKEGLDIAASKALPIFLEHCDVDPISNIVPTFLYMERDLIMDEQRYVFSIDYSNGSSPDIIALEGTNITSPDAFHKALLNKSKGGTFDGDPHVLKILRNRWLFYQMKMVESIPYVGYHTATKAWVFQKHAYHAGKEIPLNKHGYFQIRKTGIKTSLNGVSINTGGNFTPNWLPKYIEAFGMQGLALLAFWTGSLFAQQIRAKHKSFPFLEFTGEPGAGKSTALEFCWKLVGRDDYEGFDVMKSSLAGRRRAFNQLSNLPVVLIESDRDNGEKDARQKQFDFDACKPFFNGRGTGTLGVARRNNDVEEHLFQGTLIVSQNAEVDGSEALLQRIVHVHVDKKHHGPGTRETARQFERQTSDTVGGFLTVALKKEQAWLATYESHFDRIEKGLTESGLQNERIAKNHAQVAACGYALREIFPKIEEQTCKNLQTYLWQRAQAREQRLTADHPLVEQFWDQLTYINRETGGSKTQDWLNHSTDENQIAVNLNQYLEQCRHHGQDIPDLKQLKKLLPHSKRHKLVDKCKVVNSPRLSKAMRCWVFQK